MIEHEHTTVWQRLSRNTRGCGRLQISSSNQNPAWLCRPGLRGFDAQEKSAEGFTFVELMASITIILLLTTIALPLARVQIQRAKEVELRRDLRQIREAIDHYKDFADHQMIPVKADTFGYPPDLQTLVDGVTLKGAATAKYKFLRRVPIDPMTDSAEWGMRSMQDDTDSKSWGGQNVFDVYSKSEGTALDGTKYSDW